jgi:uncharacterized protein YjhX (UPF0386 family)
MLGAIQATGALSAGSVELSAATDLLNLDLALLTLGQGGHLLLDPRNITIITGGGSPLASNDQFAENPSNSVFIAPASITALLNAGTSVTLQANRDITVSSAITVNNPGGNGGDLTLQAGRRITINADITTDNGNLTLVANETTANGVVGSQRGTGSAVLTFAGRTITAGTGAVTILMNTGAGLPTSTSGNISLGTIASAGSVSVTYSGPTATGLIQLQGNITATGNISLSDRNLRLAASSTLTSTSGTVTWAGEVGGKTLVGAAGGETIKFVENGVVTRIGLMDTADAARLAIDQFTPSREYGDANPATEALRLVSGTLRAGDTLDGILAAGSLTTTWDAGAAPTATTNVGSYGYTVGPTSGISINATERGYFINTTPVASSLTITPAPLTVSANTQTKVYGDADPAFTYTATGFKNGETSAVLTGSLARAAGETVAGGPYAINQGTLTGTNYAISYTGANLTITPAPLAVTADAQTKVYGDADPALIYTASGFKFSDTAGSVLTGALTRAAGETVAGGPYAITQGSLVANTNYTISYAGANLAITPAPLTVTADAQTKVYGDADPALTYVASGFKFSDTAGTVLTGSLTRSAGESVVGGPYAISQGTLAANSNYSLSYTGANLTITPAPLTVTVDAKSKIYGDADPALTYTASGFKFSDTAGTVLSGALSRTAGETVAGGPYAITQGSLAANTNYTISYTGANLTITPAPLSITADAQTKVYGDADPALTYAASGFKLSDTAGTVLTGALSRAPGESVAGGPYAITQGSLAANSNYTVSYTGANLTISPAPLTVTADTQTKVYGDADPALTYIANGFKFSDTAGAVLTGALTRTAGETVAGGPYAITQGTLAANGNYSLSYAGANLTITPAPLTVTADARTKVYGDADPTLTYAASGFKFSDTVGTVLTGALTRAAGETVAGGPYAITQGSLAANSNYTVSYTGANLTISPAPLTVTADTQTKVYGDADPSLTYTATGFKFSDTVGTVLTGALSRAAGETVAGGPYAITQGSLAANSNYSLSYTGANLTITAAPLTVTADAKTKVYGDADPALTYTASGFKFSDTAGTVLTGALTRAAGETVAGGPYAITQGSLAANTNYTISYTGANLTITAAPLTVTADVQTKVYGDADPALTYAASGFKFSDTAASVLSGALTRAAGESVAGGPYAITQGSLAANGNYSLTFIGANLTITAAPLTVTADAKTKVYGDADPALTYAAVGFKFSDTVGTVLTGALTRAAGETVAGGPYAITQGTLAANSNYSISYTGAILTITAAPLTVTADAKSKVYGDADPALTYTASGFKFSDTAGAVLTGALTRTAGETVAGGPYAITQGSLAANTNYTISYTSANLTITPAPLTVTADAQTKVYGDADPALTYTASGFKLSDTAGTVLTGALTRAAGETVAGGPYAITQGSLAANTNYTISYTGANLTITPAPLSITADAQTKVYGDADPALTYAASGFKLSDTAGTVLTGALTRAAGETVVGGPYAITQGSLAANSNYSLSYTGANLTITPAPLTVTADAQTKVYGDTDPTLTCAASGFKFSDTAGTVLTGALTRAPGETVAGGPYVITQGSLTANSNYTVSYTGANLMITPAPLMVTADAKSKVYGDADPVLTYAANGFKFSDTAASVLSGALTRMAGESVAGGPYAITQGTLAANSNYSLSYTGANLTITPAPLMVTADAKSKVYGDADPVLTYSASGFKLSDTAGAVLSGALTRAAGETVAGGPYAITQGSLTANSNYNLSYAGANLTITPAPLTVTVDAQTKVYGDADPTLTYTASGFKFSDTAGTVLAGVLTRAVGETVAGGPYAITQGTLAANSNYSISYTGANLTITPAPLTVTADAQTKVYGDADPALSYMASGFKLSDTAGTVLTGMLTRAAGETVVGGPYAIIQGSLAANSNYSLSYTSANLTITPAPLTVTADVQTKIYGDADPALTYTASGFKLSDTAGTVLTGALSRAAGESVAGGPYAITQGSLAANSNYSLSYTGANLTITPAPLTVTADAQTKVYGDADPVPTYTATGFKFSDTAGTVLTGGLTRAAGETVAGGPYAITQGSLAANSNYSLSYTGANLTITPAPLTVTADAQTKVYGDADPALTYTAAGFKFGETAAVLTGVLSRVAGESVAGSPYSITQGTLAGANYSITFTGATLTVAPAPLTVTAAVQTKVYGDADPALTYTATGFKFGETAAVLTGALSRAAGETVAGGPYAINQGTLAGPNYSITFAGATLIITPAPLLVVANHQTKVFGDPDPALTYTVSGFRFADTAGGVLTGALSRVAGETVAGSPYAILQGTLAANSNYSISFAGALLTITGLPAAMTAGGITTPGVRRDVGLSLDELPHFGRNGGLLNNQALTCRVNPEGELACAAL